VTWYIDSIDARAGLAFASQRAPDLIGGGSLDADLPAAFIAPPDFRVVLLPHRALGLSAARRTYQAGLFRGGREVDFPHLDDVVEFTRRCFLRGGGGDGQDRTDGGPPAPLPDPGPPLEGLVRLDEDIATGGKAEGDSIERTFRDDYRAFEAAVADTPLGLTLQVSWGSARRAPAGAQLRSDVPMKHADGARCLLRAASQLLEDMLLRIPRGGPSEEWIASAASLWATIGRLGLWPLLHFDQARVTARLGTPPGEQLPFFFWDRAWGGLYGDAGSWEAAEAIGVPASLARAVKIDNPRRASLHDFLAAFLAVPVADDRALHLALFAASCIVAGPEFGRLTWPTGPRATWLASLAAHIDRLADRAKHWLDDQLPRRAFSGEVEAMIDDVIGLRIGGPQ
jgi:hypothetical protein